MQKITRFVLWLSKNFHQARTGKRRRRSTAAGFSPSGNRRSCPAMISANDVHYRNFSRRSPSPAERATHRPARSAHPRTGSSCVPRLRKPMAIPCSLQFGVGGLVPPPTCRCTHCGAPACYLYCNDGRQASQLRCKVCGGLSRSLPAIVPRNPLLVPLLSQRPLPLEAAVRVHHKCPNDRCSLYLQKKATLNWNEKLLQQLRLSQFKLRYDYRRITPSWPNSIPRLPTLPPSTSTRIRRHSDLLGLII